MKIIKHSGHREWTEYTLHFDYVGAPRYCGYAFDCDQNGNVNESKLSDCARGSLAECRANANGIYQPGRVEKFDRAVFEYAEGRCECGEIVILDRFTNPCDCGRDYNMFGQELAPRDQWGEETGETEAVLYGI